MNKNKKSSFVIILLLGILLLLPSKVNAHSIELDPNSLIRFSMMIIGGNGKITIDDSQTNYQLYYQVVEIPNEIYETLEQIEEKEKEEQQERQEEIKQIKEEFDRLEVIRDEAVEIYQEKIENGITGEELEIAKTDYETAQENLQCQLKELEKKSKENEEKMEEVRQKEKELTPNYIEKNWTKTEDGNFYIDRSQFSGKKAYVVWAKLISLDGSISYDESIYTVTGNKTEEIKVEEIQLNKIELTLIVGSSEVLTVHVTPTNSMHKPIIWQSNNEEIAIVTDGKVIAKAPGTATITASTEEGNQMAICQVKVLAKTDTPKNNTVTKTEREEEKIDRTTAKEKLPYTGKNMALLFGILAMIIISTLCYKKNQKYKNIKF